jgi:hypothetical protein
LSGGAERRYLSKHGVRRRKGGREKKDPRGGLDGIQEFQPSPSEFGIGIGTYRAALNTKDPKFPFDYNHLFFFLFFFSNV